jgi:hypothetical protein
LSSQNCGTLKNNNSGDASGLGRPHLRRARSSDEARPVHPHLGPLLRVSKLVRDAALLIVGVFADPDEYGASGKCASATKTRCADITIE